MTSIPVGISVGRLKIEAEAMSQAGYFVDALAKFIGTVGAHDPELCDQALDGYVVGGLAAGLRLIGSELMNRGDEFATLIAKSENVGGGVQ
ncbi:hypothetical protein [Pseudomonas fluorescens]|uniref:hypothetical protein n=1 Tax=Pseudomonas fluorescens TaxID=294 RepID=UPI000F4A58A0|nr:hypothetical protein [Pseudomonas fluorescens]RON90380.1 hypothetical protein BK668_11815 [Pseudomonas fluorescens]